MRPGLRGWILLGAALAPLLRAEARPLRPASAFAGFPTQLEGRPLSPAAAHELEGAYLERFPGQVGRFTDGTRLWILRWVDVPTLALHSSARCLRAAGWEVQPAEAWRDADGRLWSRSHARRDARTLVLRERVESLASGESWPDVDAWRWAAWIEGQGGPWLALTALEPP